MFRSLKSKAGVLALTAMMVGVPVVGLAAPASAVAQPKTFSFNASVAGTVTATGAGTFALAGTGIASQLGIVSYSGTVQITSDPGDLPITDTLVETFTAKNGDSITLFCSQVATPIGNTGVLHGIDTWTVVGGTGKFAGATGSGTGDTLIYNLALFAKSSKGTINY